ncbi:MAG TPA: hypothetical protein VGM07_21685 [Stellaceae bacterium]
MEDRLLTVKEFCKQARICRATFYNICARGEGPETSCVGRKRMVSAEAAETWHKWRTCALSRDEVKKLAAGMVWEVLPELMDAHGAVRGLAVFAHQLGVIAEALGAGQSGEAARG